MGIQIDRVITKLIDFDSMELINITTDLDPYTTDNWVDLSTFDYYKTLSQEDDTKVNLYDHISTEEANALKTKQVDYIVFRSNE